MRLPITPQISTKDGVSAKNARLTNCLKESKKAGDKAVVRPGLVLDAVASGVGNGLVVFNNELVSVYGTTLGFGVTPPAELDSTFYNIAGVQLIDIKAFNGEWICCNADQIYHTSDFVTFTPILTPGDYETNTESGRQSLATNGTVTVCPFYNLNTDDTGFLSISTSYVETEVVLAYTPYIVIYGGSKFCGMRSTTQSVTSTDGTTWTDGTAFVGSLFSPAIAWSGSMFCLIGTSVANILYARTSSDGLTWTEAVTIKDISGQSNWNTPICWAGDRFVVSGKDWCSTSFDGVTWDTPYFPYPYDFQCKALSYNSSIDTVLAIGMYPIYSNPHTKMISNDNGATWIDTDDVAYNGIDYNDCVEDGTGFIAVGSTVVSGAANNIEVMTSEAGTIPALATITGDYYDFAQSPI